MEKTLRDTVLRKTIEDLEMSEDIVEKVISWSYKNANEATKTNSEVEISGLGVFKVSTAKVRRRIKMLERVILQLNTNIQQGKSKSSINDYIKIESCMDSINYCNSKNKDEDRTK